MSSVQPAELIAIGVMSGTSVDAIDVAIVRAQGAGGLSLVEYCEHPMPAELREPILRLAEPGMDEIDAMGSLDAALGKAIAAAVLRSLDQAGVDVARVSAIGSHGQTIRHRPLASHPFSLQIGCPSTIAEITGITTVADFRRRDIAAGGQGAPLTPLAHRLLFADPGRCVAVVNIGGIANITCLQPDGRTVGFDSGPGNMVMDALMLTLSDGRDAYDRHGALAASGQVCEALLEELLNHPFFSRPAPKSTGREEFGAGVLRRILGWQGISDADRMATAAELTVSGIARSRMLLPSQPDRYYLCGGGVSNDHVVRRLREVLAPAEVASTESAGVPAAAVEAVSFALFGLLTLAGSPNTEPQATGATHAVSAGHIAPGRNWPQVIEQIRQAAWTPSRTP